MADSSATHWHPPAAYLYTVHLDGPSLAWEYLRRNPDYQLDWQRQRPEVLSPQRWGLRLFEDPSCDARSIQPTWQADIDAAIPVRTDDDPPEDAPPFCLWDIPGHKILSDDGQHLRLTSFVGCQVARMAIAHNLEDGMPYTYAVRAGLQSCARWRAIEAQLAVLDAPPVVSHPRPNRSSLAHMRTLQALDGILAGASHREVADAVFGSRAVAERWHADGDLRAQVRRLIRGGQALMTGGYRRLLQIDPSA
jgi:hypothetical protein